MPSLRLIIYYQSKWIQSAGLLANISSHVQKEDAIRQKTFYYIHYREAIDAIKWKVHATVTKIKADMGSDAHPQGYVCPMCRRRYNPLEVISSQSPDGMNFVCDDCGNILIEDDTSEESKANQERLRRLMDQLNPIINSLRKIDDIIVPENTFESSLAVALPPSTRTPSQRDSSLPTARPDSSARQNGVSLQVNITSDVETAKLERKMEEDKARLAEENALPAWHLQSTVGKSMYSGETEGTASGGMPIPQVGAVVLEDAKSAVKEESKAVSGLQTSATENAVDAYFAQLSAKQKEDDEDDEDDDEDDEDDDDEFEDVPAAPVAPVAKVEEMDDESDSD